MRWVQDDDLQCTSPVPLVELEHFWWVDLGTFSRGFLADAQARDAKARKLDDDAAATAVAFEAKRSPAAPTEAELRKSALAQLWRKVPCQHSYLGGAPREGNHFFCVDQTCPKFTDPFYRAVIKKIQKNTFPMPLVGVGQHYPGELGRGSIPRGVVSERESRFGALGRVLVRLFVHAYRLIIYHNSALSICLDFL